MAHARFVFIVALQLVLPAGQAAAATAPREGSLAERIDADRDGALARAEVDAFVRDRVQAIDRNGDDAIDVEELRALREQRRATRAHRRLARLDENHDGRVSVAELAARRSALLMRFDRDGDGAISPAEREAARAEWRGRGRD